MAVDRSWLPLVELPYDGGVAAVCRDEGDGSFWLTGDLGRGGSGLEGFEPGVEGLSGERTVVGGRLPSPASSAAVRRRTGEWFPATVGRGAWIAVLDEPARGGTSVALFRGADGEIVARPVRRRARLEPVVDADEPCPACGRGEWDTIRFRRWFSRRGWGDDETEGLRCRTCGHQEGGGFFTIYGPVDASDAYEYPEPSEAVERTLDRSRQEAAAAVRDATFALYELDEAWEGPRHVSGWGGGTRRAIGRVSLRHGPFDPTEGPVVDVETSVDPDRLSDDAQVREALESLFFDQDETWPRKSRAAMQLWHSARERVHRARGARAEVRPVTIPIDGVPTRFTLAEEGELWAAVSQRDEVTITITARGVALTDLALRTLRDPTAYGAPTA